MGVLLNSIIDTIYPGDLRVKYNERIVGRFKGVNVEGIEKILLGDNIVHRFLFTFRTKLYCLALKDFPNEIRLLASISASAMECPTPAERLLKTISEMKKAYLISYVYPGWDGKKVLTDDVLLNWLEDLAGIVETKMSPYSMIEGVAKSFESKYSPDSSNCDLYFCVETGDMVPSSSTPIWRYVSSRLSLVSGAYSNLGSCLSSLRVLDQICKIINKINTDKREGTCYSFESSQIIVSCKRKLYHNHSRRIASDSSTPVYSILSKVLEPPTCKGGSVTVAPWFYDEVSPTIFEGDNFKPGGCIYYDPLWEKHENIFCGLPTEGNTPVCSAHSTNEYGLELIKRWKEDPSFDMNVARIELAKLRHPLASSILSWKSGIHTTPPSKKPPSPSSTSSASHNSSIFSTQSSPCRGSDKPVIVPPEQVHGPVLPPSSSGGVITLKPPSPSNSPNYLAPYSASTPTATPAPVTPPTATPTPPPATSQKIQDLKQWVNQRNTQEEKKEPQPPIIPKNEPQTPNTETTPTQKPPSTTTQNTTATPTSELTSKVDALLLRLDVQEQRINLLEAKLLLKENENTELTKQMKNQAQQHLQSLDEVKKKFTQLESELKARKLEGDVLKLEISSLDSQIQQMKEENDKLKKEVGEAERRQKEHLEGTTERMNNLEASQYQMKEEGATFSDRLDMVGSVVLGFVEEFETMKSCSSGAPSTSPTTSQTSQIQATSSNRPLVSPVRYNVWKKKFDKIEGPCPICETNITISQWEASHIVSRANGGSNEVNNLLPLCMNCNRSMGRMNMPEYVKVHFPQKYASVFRGTEWEGNE